MAPRGYEQVWADAVDGRAFSNGTEGEIWMGNWCWRCTNDDADNERYCPILGVALAGRVPKEWIEQPWAEVDGCKEPPLDRYHCVEFREHPHGEDPPDGDPEPRWDPDMPGQRTVFDYWADGIADQASRLTLTTTHT